MVRRPPKSKRTDTLFPETTLFRSRPEYRSLGVTMMVTTGSISKLRGWGVFRLAPGGGSRAAPTSWEDGSGRRKRPPGACPHARDGARAGPDVAVAGHCLRNTS